MKGARPGLTLCWLGRIIALVFEPNIKPGAVHAVIF